MENNDAKENSQTEAKNALSLLAEYDSDSESEEFNNCSNLNSNSSNKPLVEIISVVKINNFDDSKNFNSNFDNQKDINLIEINTNEHNIQLENTPTLYKNDTKITEVEINLESGNILSSDEVLRKKKLLKNFKEQHSLKMNQELKISSLENYREIGDGSSLDTDSDSSSSLSGIENDNFEDSSLSDECDNEDQRINKNRNQKKYKKSYDCYSTHAKGELKLSDLPKIEDLKITVPEKECKEMGSVQSIVQQLVVIEAIKNLPPLNIDTILFLNKGNDTLGKIFDVIGRINEPLYVVRFNTSEEIKLKNIDVGTKVYCAPKTEHTTYILIAELLKSKGSDASWKDDIEPPPSCLDYSDDEEERRARAEFKQRKKQDCSENVDIEPDSRKRPITNTEKKFTNKKRPNDQHLNSHQNTLYMPQNRWPPNHQRSHSNYPYRNIFENNFSLPPQSRPSFNQNRQHYNMPRNFDQIAPINNSPRPFGNFPTLDSNIHAPNTMQSPNPYYSNSFHPQSLNYPPNLFNTPPPNFTNPFQHLIKNIQTPPPPPPE